MRDLTDRALDTAAKLGATYADVRVIRRRDESISVKSGRVEGVALGETDGFGVRVVVDGAWGFAASDTLDLAEADRVGAVREGRQHGPGDVPDLARRRAQLRAPWTASRPTV